MNILSIESVLTAEAEVPSAEALSERIDAMHDVLTSDSSVLSADILTTDGGEIRFLLCLASLEDEGPEATQGRADVLIAKAFEAAHIAITESSREGSNVTSKAFALV